MSAIVLNTSGSSLLAMECSSFGLGDGERVFLDRDVGVAPVVLRRFRKPAACLAPRQGHAVAYNCNVGFGQDIDDELPRSQVRADLEVRLLHHAYFLNEMPRA